MQKAQPGVRAAIIELFCTDAPLPGAPSGERPSPDKSRPGVEVGEALPGPGRTGNSRAKLSGTPPSGTSGWACSHGRNQQGCCSAGS